MVIITLSIKNCTESSNKYHKYKEIQMPSFDQDEKMMRLIEEETERQINTISLIASENYAPSLIREIESSVLMNKYAEGYPGKRYYAGCQIIDMIEGLAIERAKRLFKAEHANVQPHAGSQANFAVYACLLQPGDTILGMSLSSGGHLTHGHPVNLSGMLYNIIHYDVNKNTGFLDYEQIEELALKHKPKLIIAGASAYSREIDFQRFSQICAKSKAYLLADISHIAGLIAAELHPSPVPYADFVTSTTHKSLRGPRGAFILCKKEHATALDRAVMPGTQGGPFMHIIAAKAAAFHLASLPSFKKYQEQVIKNAKAMVEFFQQQSYQIISGGTDNHLFILDLQNKNISGLDAEKKLERAGITVSRSAVPFDTQKPWITSGIRIGTPAMTTRGMKEKEAILLAQLIDELIMAHEETHVLQTQRKVLELASMFRPF